jgi:hypothetical protein
MPHAVQSEVDVSLQSGSTEICFHLVPFVEICPSLTDSRPGDTDLGLKLIHIEYADNELIIECEGLAGRSYEIPITCPEMIAGVAGGKLVLDRVRIDFPDKNGSMFIRKTIRLKTHDAG